MNALKTIFIILIVILATYAEKNPLFPAYVTTGSPMQNAFNGGGSALPDKASGITLNPASVYVYQKMMSVRGGISGSYSNLKELQRTANGAGSFALNNKSVVAVDYQYQNDFNAYAPKIHRGTIAYSALVKEDKGEGLLSMGVSVSYYDNKGMYEGKKELPVTIGDSILYYSNGYDSIGGFQREITTDLGFYQLDVQHGVAYSFIFENLFGYTWEQRDNSLETLVVDTIIKDSTIGDSITPDTTYKDSTYYSGNERKDYRKLDGHKKSLLVGITVRRTIAGGNVIMSIPFDVRFWGWLDGDLRDHSAWKNRNMLRTGIDLDIKGHVSLRVGYSWAPLEYKTTDSGRPDFRNHHQASGGFKISLRKLDLEMAFKKDYFLAGGSLYF